MCSYSKNKHKVTKRRIIGVREHGKGSHVWLSDFWDQGSEQMALTSSILPLALLCCKEMFIHLCV